MGTRTHLIALPSRLTLPLALIGLLSGLLSTTVACGASSIEDQCDDIARDQCASCYACAADLDEVEGAELCGLTSESDEGACADRLRTRCEDQASTLEDSSEDLQSCVDSLDDLSCEALYGAWAQDRDSATDACVFFL